MDEKTSTEDGVFEPRPESLVVPDEREAPEAVDARGVVAVVHGDACAPQLLHQMHAVLLKWAVLWRRRGKDWQRVPQSESCETRVCCRREGVKTHAAGEDVCGRHLRHAV